jgi:hypothetical protein
VALYGAMPGDKPRGLSSLDDLIARGPTAVTTVVGLVTFASCYFRSFVFPNIPLLPGGDQIGFYTAGSRIVAGELPYRDFFEILPVGTELVYATLIKLFGFCTWIPGIVMAVLVSAAAVLVTRAARHAMRGLATLLPALFLVGFLLIDESFNATHHWFCTVAAMAAMLALLEGVTAPRIALAGGLAGLATCFTQTTGAFVVAALAIYLLWHAKQTASSPQWRQAILLCTSAVAVFAAVNGYFIWQGGLGRWFFATVVFPVRYFTAPTLNNWRVLKYDFPSHPSFRRWLSYPFLFLSIPLVYLGFFLARKRRNPSESTEAWDKLVLIALTGAGMLMAVAFIPEGCKRCVANDDFACVVRDQNRHKNCSEWRGGACRDRACLDNRRAVGTSSSLARHSGSARRANGFFGSRALRRIPLAAKPNASGRIFLWHADDVSAVPAAKSRAHLVL